MKKNVVVRMGVMPGLLSFSASLMLLSSCQVSNKVFTMGGVKPSDSGINLNRLYFAAGPNEMMKRTVCLDTC